MDDKQPNLPALSAVLAGLGHEVVTADSGQAALKALLDDGGFAVILLDVQMPDMDGYETALHITRRARTRNITIIFLTAMDHDPSHVFRGCTAGAVDYLAKPYDPWISRAKVEAFVQMHLEARATLWRRLGSALISAPRPSARRLVPCWTCPDPWEARWEA